MLSIIDPGSSAPVLAGVSEHVVIEAKDVTMDPELWALRFGSRDDLFDEADADALIALAGQHLGSLLVVLCVQGISRSTACAALLFAAADGLGREDALVAAREAQEKGFAWRERRGFIPNERFLDVGFARLCRPVVTLNVDEVLNAATRQEHAVTLGSSITNLNSVPSSSRYLSVSPMTLSTEPVRSSSSILPVGDFHRLPS